MNTKSRVARGFTLIELLVVVAIIAILIGILLPALSKARSAGWQIVSASTQRQLMVAMIGYATSNDQWIPGVNTSGRRFFGVAMSSGSPEVQSMERLGTVPTAPQDWISPIMGDELPTDREARLEYIFNTYADPAMGERPAIWGGPGSGTTSAPSGNAEFAQYLAENNRQNPIAASYLMPIVFQLFGGTASVDGSIIEANITSGGAPAIMGRTHVLPATYRPRISSVGSPSRKAGIASGTRFFSDSGPPTTEASYGSVNFHSFADRNPVDQSSTAWGHVTRQIARPTSGLRPGARLSYRHAGRINVAFFDGHVEALGDVESRNPHIWAPTGSIFLRTSSAVDIAAQSFFGPIGETGPRPTVN